MTSHLSSGTNRRQSPAYCKKGKFIGVDPISNGRPVTLNAYAAYRYVGTAIDVDANELIHLRRNSLDNGWTGYVTDGTNRLTVDVLDPPSGNLYDLLLYLDVDGTPVTHTQWVHEQPPTAERWDTGPLTNVVIPDEDQSALRILG